jgi:hypothetical protein
MVDLTVKEWVTAAQKLVNCDNPEEIRRLERLLECTHEEAVSSFIEESCCGEDLPEYIGGKGTAAERRDALRALWRQYEAQQG